MHTYELDGALRDSRTVNVGFSTAEDVAVSAIDVGVASSTSSSSTSFALA